jgi:CPA1 family monovalent cation:H+ antiporter
MTDPLLATPTGRPRARALPVPFDGTPGPLNAITDVPGVEVGYCTVIRGEGPLVVGRGPVRTGVTAILPRGRGGLAVPVFAGTHALNGNGELTGSLWIEESGQCEGPVTITSTHACGLARDATVRWLVERHPGAVGDWGLPVAGETYDGELNDINGFHVTPEHVFEALESAKAGPLELGSVGGGTGMICYDFKGGSGSASRVVAAGGEGEGGSYVLGAFVQANFGRRRELTVAGVPVGRHLPGGELRGKPAGSIIAVIATDAPLLPHQLKRLARRVGLLGRHRAQRLGRHLPRLLNRQRGGLERRLRAAGSRLPGERGARPAVRGGGPGDRRGGDRFHGGQRDHGRARRQHRAGPAPRPAARPAGALRPRPGVAGADGPGRTFRLGSRPSRALRIRETVFMSPFDAAAALVVLAAVLGYLNYRFIGLQHTIGLTVMGAVASLAVVGADALYPGAGLGLAVRGFLAGIDFHKALMEGMLSFLLFAGALHVDLGNLLRRKAAVFFMATVGVLVSTAVVAAGFKLAASLLGLELPFLWCLVFGALISPTDPVAVLGILKSAKVPPTLEAKVAGESLFNDGVGVVVFSILLAAALGAEPFSLARAGELFAVEALGGALLGLGLGWIVYRAMKAIDEHNLEVLLTLALVMGGYALAHRIHVSGPVAMAVAGLLIGNHGTRFAMSERTREHVTRFWSLLDEVLNSVLFLLIGLEVIAIALEAAPLLLGAVSIAVVLAARAAAVGLPIALLARFAPFTKGAFPVLVWGGLRGGISIALALSLPDGPIKATILTATYVVVVFSVAVQGATVGLLARRVVAGAE